MKKDHRKYNKNHDVFVSVAQKLKSMFPHGIKIGMHTEASNLYNIGYFKNKTNAVYACVELENNNVNLRIFRTGSNGPKYKIDMIRGVDKRVSNIVQKSEFDHYINTDIPKNIMARNNISIRFIADKSRNFVPKIDENGMLEAFINFPDSYKIIK